MDLNPTDDWSNVDKQELQEFFFEKSSTLLIFIQLEPMSGCTDIKVSCFAF
jgi:hypothetical protein